VTGGNDTIPVRASGQEALQRNWKI